MPQFFYPPNRPGNRSLISELAQAKRNKRILTPCQTSLHPRIYRVFALMIAFIWRAKKSKSPLLMENLIVGLIALGLIVYLILTIIRPENF
jgi:hypothetical protein